MQRIGRTIVVGGGPAGLMAAQALVDAGADATVFDAMPSLARKLTMAGVSGLNITHAEDFARFLSRYGAAAPLLVAALHAFPPQALRDFCAGLGQETFVGSSGRVFPRAMKAAPLLRAWLARLAAGGARARTRMRFVGFEGAACVFRRADGARETVAFDACVLALGGASWPRLGADGAWVETLRAAGADVAPLEPANCGLLADWPQGFLERHEGAPIKNIVVTAAGATARGDMTITRRGLEGGPVYALASAVRAAGAEELVVDFKPDLDIDALAARLAKTRAKDSRANALRKAGLAPAAIALLRLSRGGPAPREATALAMRIKCARLPIAGVAGLDRAISTSGGVTFESLDEHFMLRARPGVFVAGEMLDWDAPTGGYLLQACFATGRAAGVGAARYLESLNPR